MAPKMIETTIGDLICAIKDAADEAQIDLKERQKLAELVLIDMLSRSTITAG